MRALKLFTWFGIPVFLHWTFGLLVLYIAWTVGLDQFDWSIFLFLLGFVASLFTCVLLHEYGHALTARRFGVQTRDILLTPIGGIARLERMPEKPAQELQVALAGPLVNVVIALLLTLVCRVVFREEEWEFFKWLLLQLVRNGEVGNLGNTMLFLAALLVANIMLVLFNLAPAFPMDGGRVLRALLAMRMGRVRATKVAAWFGQAIASLFIGYGLFNGQFMLVLVGIFVFGMARSENYMVQLDDVLNRTRATEVMRTDFTRLLISDWMHTAVERAAKGEERNFLVFDFYDQVAGILTEARIEQARQQGDTAAPVGSYLSHHVEVVHPQESLRYVYYLLQTKGTPLVAVANETGLLGVIDDARLMQFLRKKGS